MFHIIMQLFLLSSMSHIFQKEHQSGLKIHDLGASFDVLEPVFCKPWQLFMY